MEYPKTGVGTHQPEQIWRDFDMMNTRINAHKWRWLKDIVDIIDAHRFNDDFCQSLDDGIRWNVDVVELGQGSATYTCTDMVNGVILLTNAAGDNDNVEVTQLCECWKLVNNFPLYAEMRVKISDSTQSDFWFGLVTGDNWFTAPNDYVVFHKDDGDQNIDFSCALNGTATNTDTGQDMADNTWIRLGFHWDGDGTLRWFVIQDGVFPQITLATGSVTTNICQDEELGLGFGVQNGEAVAKSLYVDYIKCVQLRVIE